MSTYRHVSLSSVLAMVSMICDSLIPGYMPATHASKIVFAHRLVTQAPVDRTSHEIIDYCQRHCQISDITFTDNNQRLSGNKRTVKQSCADRSILSVCPFVCLFARRALLPC